MQGAGSDFFSAFATWHFSGTDWLIDCMVEDRPGLSESLASTSTFRFESISNLRSITYWCSFQKIRPKKTFLCTTNWLLQNQIAHSSNWDWYTYPPLYVIVDPWPWSLFFRRFRGAVQRRHCGLPWIALFSMCESSVKCWNRLGEHIGSPLWSFTSGDES